MTPTTCPTTSASIRLRKRVTFAGRSGPYRTRMPRSKRQKPHMYPPSRRCRTKIGWAQLGQERESFGRFRLRSTTSSRAPARQDCFAFGESPTQNRSRGDVPGRPNKVRPAVLRNHGTGPSSAPHYEESANVSPECRFRRARSEKHRALRARGLSPRECRTLRESGRRLQSKPRR